MMEAEIKENTENKQKKRWKRTLFGVITLFVVAGGAFVFLLFNSSATGTVRVVEKTTPIAQEAARAPKRFDGKYVAFRYPGDYAPREADKDVVSVEKGLFVASGQSSRTLAFSVMDMQGKQLDDIPSYRLRNDVKSSEYRREEKETNGSDAIVFTKMEGGYERSVFILHRDILVTVSVSGQVFTNPQVLENDFEMIFNSLEFVN